MEDCFRVNRVKKSKQFGGKWNKQSIDEFQKLTSALNFLIEDCIIDFYKPISESVCKVLSFENEDTVPTLFIRGHCVSWDLLRKNFEVRHSECSFLWVTSSDTNPANSTLGAVKDAEEKNKSIFIFVLQFECFARNHFIQHILGILKRSRISSFLAINTTTNFLAITERIGRLCSTSLNVLTLELSSPAKLADKITKELFLHSKGSLSTIQFSGDLLLLARRRYLTENYSLTEFKKCFVLALINFCTSCVKQDKGRKNKLEHRPNCFLQTYEHILQGLSSLLQISSDSSSLESLLQLHYKIQTGEFFENEYIHLKNNSSKWKKDQWVARLQLLSRFLMDDEALQDKLGACKDLIDQLSAPVENDENYAVDTLPKTKSKKTAANYLKKKQTTENKAKISEDQFKSIFIFLDDLFENMLKTLMLPENLLVRVTEDQKCLLRTSTTLEIDTKLGLNDEQEPNSTNQDVCIIYRLLVNFNKECYTAELGDLFDAFKAIGIEDIPGCDLASRFFNAVGFLEYIGALQHVSDGVVKLLYLPSTSPDLFI